MTKKHYIQILISGLLVLIAAVMFSYYYNTYIAPESFVIGSVQLEDYKTLPIKDYLSDDTVLFSQNINDVTFSNKNGVAIYEYNFDAKDFNGEERDYLICVNDYIVNDLVENAGTISGTCNLNYYDTEKQVLCASAIRIDFSFYSLKSLLRVTVNSEDLGYLMNYFRTDNFIITLTENPFTMMNQDMSKESLLLEISDYKKLLEQLTLEKDNLQIELENAYQDNLTNSEIILNLEALIQEKDNVISDLNYRLSYLEQLLEAYENSSKLAVTFEVDGQVYDVQLVDSGDYATSPVNPTKEGAEFAYWAINGSSKVVSSYQITKDTKFVAVFKYILHKGVTLLGEYSAEQMTNGFIIDFSDYVNFNKPILQCKKSLIQIQIYVYDNTVGDYVTYVDNNKSKDTISFAGLGLVCKVGEDNTLHFNPEQTYNGTYENYRISLNLIEVTD